MIITERLLLRPWRDTDREPFALLNADPEVMEYLGGPQTPAESNATIDRQLALIAEAKPAYWAAEHRAEGRFLGYIGIKEMSFATPSGAGFEIGWRLARANWGQGYASEGARAVAEYGFTALALKRLFSFTVLANRRSRAVMQRIGMRRIENGDFQHPALPLEHPLSWHVLYVLDQDHKAAEIAI